LLKEIVNTYPNPQAAQYKLNYLEKIVKSGGKEVVEPKNKVIIKETRKDSEVDDESDGAI
jgi:hypothetical protein